METNKKVTSSKNMAFNIEVLQSIWAAECLAKDRTNLDYIIIIENAMMRNSLNEFAAFGYNLRVP